VGKENGRVGKKPTTRRGPKERGKRRGGAVRSTKEKKEEKGRKVTSSVV